MNSLSNEELVQIYQDGDKRALDILIENNKGMVYKIAYKFNQVSTLKKVEIDDLIQEGNLGLIIAAKKYKFDSDKKAKFITYAVHYINRYIQRCLNGHSEKEIKNNELYNSTTSLNTPIGEENNSELLEYIEGVDYSYENIEDKILLESLRIDLDKAMIETLSLIEREVLKGRYGWNYGGMTYDELGELYGYSRERIRQIENKALRVIRKSKWGNNSGVKYIFELANVKYEQDKNNKTEDKTSPDWSLEIDNLDELIRIHS